MGKNQDSLAEDMADLFAPVSAQLAQVQLRLKHHLTVSYAGLNQQLESVGAGEGKLIRPAMVLLGGLACGDLTDEHIELASIVELVHSATLLHDDVIDRAKTRRNRKSVNRLWGNTAAVLLGDFLLSRAFLSGAQLSIPGGGKILSQTAEQICLGELLQNIRKGDWFLSEQDYMDIIEAKTASLFAAACFLGAASSKADAQTSAFLREYGRCVGLAFQITDDILDIVGNPRQAGKTLGTDFLQKKLTLPVIHLLEQKNSRQKKIFFEQFSQKPDRRKLLNMLTKSGSLEYAHKMAFGLSQRAIGALSKLDSSEACDAMKKIAKAICKRI